MKTKKILAALLALSMVLTLFAVPVFADGEDDYIAEVYDAKDNLVGKYTTLSEAGNHFSDACLIRILKSTSDYLVLSPGWNTWLFIQCADGVKFTGKIAPKPFTSMGIAAYDNGTPYVFTMEGGHEKMGAVSLYGFNAIGSAPFGFTGICEAVSFGSGTKDDPKVLVDYASDISPYTGDKYMPSGYYKLLFDVNLEYNINFSNGVVFDLAGHKITSSAATVFSYANGASYTITDSVGGGKVIHNYDSIYSGDTFGQDQTGVSITIEDGYYECLDGQFLINHNNKYTIKNGTYKGDINIRAYGGSLNIWDGVFYGKITKEDDTPGAHPISIAGGAFKYDPTAFLKAGLEAKLVKDYIDGQDMYVVGAIIPEVETKVDEAKTDVKNEKGEKTELTSDDKDELTNISQNKAVNDFKGTGIEAVVEQMKANDPDAIVKLLKAAAKKKEQGEAVIDAIGTTNIDNKLVINLTAIIKKTVDSKDLFSRTEYDVTPMVRTTVMVGDTPVTVEAPLPNEEIKNGISFRLAVDDRVDTGTLVKKYHKNDFIGNGIVEKENGAKFVRFENCTDFSPYAFEITDELEWKYRYDSGSYGEEGSKKGVARFLFDSGLDDSVVTEAKVVFFNFAATSDDENSGITVRKTDGGCGAFSADLYGLDINKENTIFAMAYVSTANAFVWSDINEGYTPAFEKKLSTYDEEGGKN